MGKKLKILPNKIKYYPASPSSAWKDFYLKDYLKNKPKKKSKPIEGKSYWYISGELDWVESEASYNVVDTSSWVCRRFRIGNYFNTKKEAQAMLKRFKTMLKENKNEMENI
jgi:hypothetical protein